VGKEKNRIFEREPKQKKKKEEKKKKKKKSVDNKKGDKSETSSQI
jgi:hypothetical protein